MPVQTCAEYSKSGYRWGKSGKCFTGSSALKKAKQQEKAIYSSGWKENKKRELMNTATEHFNKTAKELTPRQEKYKKLKERGQNIGDAGRATALVVGGATHGALTGNEEDGLSKATRQILTTKKRSKSDQSLLNTMNKLRKRKTIRGGAIGTLVGGGLAAGAHALISKNRKDKGKK